MRLAGAASSIAGFGPVKDEGVAKYRAQVAELMAELDRAGEPGEAPAQAVPA